MVQILHLWQLPSTTIDHVNLALTTLARRHEALRTIFDLDNALPQQLVRESEPVRAGIIETNARSWPEATEAARHLAAEPFDLQSHPGWSCAVLRDQSGSLNYLAVALHHMVADQWSQELLKEQFLELLTSGPPEAAPDTLQPRELALLQRSSAWHGRRSGAVTYWEQVMDTLPPPEGPTRPALGVVADRISATLSYPELRANINEVARLTASSPQSVVVALLLVVMSRVPIPQSEPLMLMTANRFDKRWRGIVTTMNQVVPMPRFDHPADETFSGYVQRVHWAGQRALRHGSYDVDAIADLTRKRRGHEFASSNIINYVAPDADTEFRPGATSPIVPEDVGVQPAAWQVGLTMDVRVHGRNQLAIDFRVMTDHIGPASLRAIVAWLDRQLHTLADSGAERPMSSLLEEANW
ncbi:condensation domain-containing protein [Longispora albida]|uniref:condensation domain-containing protein n=1 Tax=Longispora albida TaxID=203523 RepID=UPI0012FA17BA|nr:condensation domain-containing protein [Longispora albida]